MRSKRLQYILSVHPCLLPLTPILPRIHLYFPDWPNNRPNSRPIGSMEIGREEEERIQTALKQAILPSKNEDIRKTAHINNQSNCTNKQSIHTKCTKSSNESTQKSGHRPTCRKKPIVSSSKLKLKLNPKMAITQMANSRGVLGQCTMR